MCALTGAPMLMPMIDGALQQIANPTGVIR